MRPVGVHAVDGKPVVLDDELCVDEGELDDGVERDLEVGQLRQGVAQQQGHQAPRHQCFSYTILFVDRDGTIV